jgi:hypothetical protein
MSIEKARIEAITDLTHKAMNALREASRDGRITWLTGHTARNDDGTVTVAFRCKTVGKTAVFKVNNEAEGKLCCKIMRQHRKE